ncbi:helix-turn-helix domain-containing protein [Photobacterium phosphoreum]|uniref:Helix-turn-helix domain-containing protein n=1 Tax=Photobacterium phosphoreum TaxID=659 RepID=A0AAW4ZSS4_PHOPO|nr:helix-turn-helix transcriptional regulator [Photobacterium phosphoreum]MCD9491374.1 helix-turn-helix domain-containing protein [Photobacterium phosphoreum]MCD9502414.1 helix-turn-helix domain-containing protein [Photobacterium phosphoreum]MCF2190640.1 helix-turn-helix domain-containing protein [Photobacterium phosphoreum]MCF2302173.1 helix-turn-helix domain-containing protein [Photobacterium phosphoreum]
MEIGKKLKAIIREERYSQREFAEQVNIPIRTIEKYIAGTNDPTYGVLIKIVNHERFKKYTLWLMTGDVNPEMGQISPAFSTQEQCGLITGEEGSQKKA